MIPRAMLAIAYATGTASHTRQVKGDDPDKPCPGPPILGLGVRLTILPRKNTLLRNIKEMKQNGYLDRDMKQYKKVRG